MGLLPSNHYNVLSEQFQIRKLLIAALSMLLLHPFDYTHLNVVTTTTTDYGCRMSSFKILNGPNPHAKPKQIFFNRCYSLLSFDGPQVYNSEAFPFTHGQYVVIDLADKLYNSVTVLFLCFAKVYLSHKLQAGTEPGLGALQHSLWPNVRSNHLAI